MLVTCIQNSCLLYTQNGTQTKESLRLIVTLAWRVKFTTISKCVNAKYSPKIIESLKVSSSPTFCSKQSQHRMQTRLLRASSSWVLKTSDNEDITTSLGTLIQCLIILMVIFLFLISSQTNPFQFMVMVLCSHAHLCLLGDLPISKDRWLLGSSTAVPSPGWANPSPPTSPHRVRSPALWPPWWPRNALVYQHYSCIACPKTGCFIWDMVQWVTSKGE